MHPFLSGPEQASIMEVGGNIARRRWNVVLNATALLKAAVDRFYPEATQRQDIPSEIPAVNTPVPEQIAQPGNEPLDPEMARRQVEYATRNSASGG